MAAQSGCPGPLSGCAAGGGGASSAARARRSGASQVRAAPVRNWKPQDRQQGRAVPMDGEQLSSGQRARRPDQPRPAAEPDRQSAQSEQQPGRCSQACQLLAYAAGKELVMRRHQQIFQARRARSTRDDFAAGGDEDVRRVVEVDAVDAALVRVEGDERHARGRGFLQALQRRTEGVRRRRRGVSGGQAQPQEFGAEDAGRARRADESEGEGGEEAEPGVQRSQELALTGATSPRRERLGRTDRRRSAFARHRAAGSIPEPPVRGRCPA